MRGREPYRLTVFLSVNSLDAELLLYFIEKQSWIIIIFLLQFLMNLCTHMNFILSISLMNLSYECMRSLSPNSNLRRLWSNFAQAVVARHAVIEALLEVGESILNCDVYEVFYAILLHIYVCLKIKHLDSKIEHLEVLEMTNWAPGFDQVLNFSGHLADFWLYKTGLGVGILTVSVCTANEHNGFVFTIYQLDKVVLHIGEYY